MNTAPMIPAHGSAPWTWPLRDREAATLDAVPVARWLRVEEGWLWVTPQQAGVHAPDLWLGAGDSLALPAGSAWVVEAWPQARMSLLLEGPAAALSRRGGRAALRPWARRISAVLASWLAGWRQPRPA